MRSRLTNLLVNPAESTSWRLSVLCLGGIFRFPKLHVAPQHMPSAPTSSGRMACALPIPQLLVISATKSRLICNQICFMNSVEGLDDDLIRCLCSMLPSEPARTGLFCLLQLYVVSGLLLRRTAPARLC